MDSMIILFLCLLGGGIVITPIYAGDCKIDVVETYGCIGCNKNAYAFFRGRDIKMEGSMRFESNCTFAKNYLACQEEEYPLELDLPEPYCYIFIPHINETIHLKIDFKYPQLTPSRPIIATSVNATKPPNF